MPACLLVLIGLPGSGKTTLARRLVSALGDRYRVVHVEYDDAVSVEEQARMWAERAAGGDEPEWREARRRVEAAVEAAIEEAVVGRGDEEVEGEAPPDAGQDTVTEDKPSVYVIDDNMQLRSMRYRYFQLARRRRLGFAQALLDVPAPECLRRNAARVRPVPDAAISAMAGRLERPDPAARVWETGSVSLPPDSDPLSLLLPLLERALRSPAPPLVDNSLEAAEARRVCSESELHQMDGLLRRLVKERVAAGDAEGRAERARGANAARLALLRRVRVGEIGLEAAPTESERFAQVVRLLFESELPAGIVSEQEEMRRKRAVQ